jgi:hypothetical protein
LNIVLSASCSKTWMNSMIKQSVVTAKDFVVARTYVELDPPDGPYPLKIYLGLALCIHTRHCKAIQGLPLANFVQRIRLRPNRHQFSPILGETD